MADQFPEATKMVLSPAAQAALNRTAETIWQAYDAAAGDGVRAGAERQGLAAALRAAADQVISPVPPPAKHFDVYAQGFRAAHVKYRAQLLAIVAELKNTPITPPEEI